MPNNAGMENISAISRACTIVGGVTSLARILGVTPPTVHEWTTSRRPIPPTRCVQIEAATEGAITRRDLRPADCENIWPELASTPASRAQAATETIANTGV